MQSTSYTIQNNNTSNRIDYLDLVKGFAILWVIWWHVCHPAFVHPYYHVPIFFFVSGIFFKSYPLKKFLIKKTNQILIPFIFFYICSFVYRIIVYLWDYRTIIGFRWNCIFDVFKSGINGDYLYVNVPLWFLICLFNMNLIYYLLSKTNNVIKCIYIFIVLLLSNYILQIPTHFFLNNALVWTAYLALGNMFGLKLIELLKKHTKAIKLILICLIIHLSIFFTEDYVTNIMFQGLMLHIKTLSFVIGIIALFSFLENIKSLSVLRFFGNNSLTTLGFHELVLIFCKRIVMMLFGCINLWGGFACFVTTAIILYFTIPLANKWFPKIIAKKPLITYKQQTL